MDDDSADLLKQLCMRAAMIMEDVCTAALTFDPRDPQARGDALSQLEDAARSIADLVRGARAIERAAACKR